MHTGLYCIGEDMCRNKQAFNFNFSGVLQIRSHPQDELLRIVRTGQCPGFWTPSRLHQSTEWL